MRMFLTDSLFISVLEPNNDRDYYSCQIMVLIHGIGGHKASIMDDQDDVVSCMVYKDFKETSKRCATLQEVVKFHLQCLLELWDV